MVDNGIHSVSLGLLLCTWNVVTSSFCADITDLNHTPKSPMFHLSQRKGSGDNEPKFLGLGLRATNEITSVIYWTSKKKQYFTQNQFHSSICNPMLAVIRLQHFCSLKDSEVITSIDSALASVLRPCPKNRLFRWAQERRLRLRVVGQTLDLDGSVLLLESSASSNTNFFPRLVSEHDSNLSRMWHC